MHALPKVENVITGGKQDFRDKKKFEFYYFQ